MYEKEVSLEEINQFTILRHEELGDASDYESGSNDDECLYFCEADYDLTDEPHLKYQEKQKHSITQILGYVRRREVSPLPPLQLEGSILIDENDVSIIDDKIYFNAATQVQEEEPYTLSEITNSLAEVIIPNNNRYSQNLETATKILEEFERTMATFTQTATETYEDAQGVSNEKTVALSAFGSSKIYFCFASNRNALRRKSFSDFRMLGDPDEDPSDNEGEFHDSNNLFYEPPNRPRLTRHKEQAVTVFYFRYLQFRNDEDKIRFFLMFLTGVIFHTYNSYLMQYEENSNNEEWKANNDHVVQTLTNYSYFLKGLKQLYGYQDKTEEALRIIQNLKQTKSAREYFQIINTYASIAGYSENQLIHHIKEGLKPIWKQEVIKMITYNPNIKYHKIKDLIIRLDDNLYREHKANTPQYRNNHSRFPNQQRNQSNQRNNQPGFRNNNPGKRPPNNQNKLPQNPFNHSPNSPSHFQKPNN
ncbi:hypothetical protein H072_8331 [Dactylellina haptotyla CBS 200.50]|uniref:Retrotransposon gag domain-containing protein n=1 Tax=Dactylellina haptotyla (strain CBS 200.50) TaxID=1284197 RepID=S8A4M7_DACHA|nr:hypothetical protein H072_8331 [Dactylellina haptotyla CBS 200.50]